MSHHRLQHHWVCETIFHISHHWTICLNFLFVVDVRWRLHFEFVTSTSDSLTPLHVDENNWQAPVDIPIETMVWNLPVTLYPTSPIQILQQSGKHSLIIK